MYLYLNDLLLQVIEQCPSLVGHARDIDIVLAKSLSEAKHYLAKTVRGMFLQRNRLKLSFFLAEWEHKKERQQSLYSMPLIPWRGSNIVFADQG